MPQSKNELRLRIKRERRELPPTVKLAVSANITQRLWQLPAVRRAQRIAIYMSVYGEIDCDLFIQQAWARKKRVFAPILARKRLEFAPIGPTTPLQLNRFGILEPVYTATDCVYGRALDVVVVPLVAFDKTGQRLGMGGGFYDRTFAFMKRRPNLRRPLLIGVAYDFQRVANLQPEPWDIPLHAVVTEKECYGSR